MASRTFSKIFECCRDGPTDSFEKMRRECIHSHYFESCVRQKVSQATTNKKGHICSHHARNPNLNSFQDCFSTVRAICGIFTKVWWVCRIRRSLRFGDRTLIQVLIIRWMDYLLARCNQLAKCAHKELHQHLSNPEPSFAFVDIQSSSSFVKT